MLTGERERFIRFSGERERNAILTQEARQHLRHLRIISEQQNLERRLGHDNNFHLFRSNHKRKIISSHPIHLTRITQLANLFFTFPNPNLERNIAGARGER